LQKYDDLLVERDENNNRIFVPLCGKSVDMAYLASKSKVSHVVGVDIIQQAAEDFAEDHPTLSLKEFQPESCDATPSGSIFHGDDITIIVGDLFDLLQMKSEDRAKYITLGSTASTDDSTSYLFDSIYDRASMVAIDPSLRNNYATQMGDMLRPGGVMLLMTLDRRKVTNDAAKSDGPPFSINESEVRQLYESQEWVDTVELLEEVDDLTTDDDKKRWEKKGVLELYELVFVIRKKSESK
jgi:thiopurine S-methyltransferase